MSEQLLPVIDTATLSPLQRKLNRELFKFWIHRDLFNRASYDIDKSVMFYDGDGDFVWAMHELPSPDLQAAFLADANSPKPTLAVRSYSVGC